MSDWHVIRKPGVVALLGGALALFVACAGASQSDLDAAKQQAAAQEKKATELQQQVSILQQQITAAGQSQQATAGILPLIGVKASAPPKPVAPAPAPTPLPPGFQPPPKPAPPAYIFEKVPFTYYVETLATTGQKFGFESTVPCTPNSVFKRGMRLVWRFEVFDTNTGKRLTDLDQAKVTIKLPHGEELTPRFSQRAGGRVPGAPWMWSSAFDIPLDYPIGAFDYTINVVSKDGREGVFKTPALVNPDPAANTDSRVKIID